MFQPVLEQLLGGVEVGALPGQEADTSVAPLLPQIFFFGRRSDAGRVLQVQTATEPYEVHVALDDGDSLFGDESSSGCGCCGAQEQKSGAVRRPLQVRPEAAVRLRLGLGGAYTFRRLPRRLDLLEGDREATSSFSLIPCAQDYRLISEREGFAYGNGKLTPLRGAYRGQQQHQDEDRGKQG